MLKRLLQYTQFIN